jgi:hypothetical protein
MKKLSIALLALASACAVAPAASASSFAFTFTLPGGELLASGYLLGSQVGNTGVYDVIAGAIGVWAPGNEYVTASLASPGVDGSDNLLTPSASGPAPYVSLGGISFDIDGYFINIYSGDQTLGEGFLGDGTDTYGIQAGPLLGMSYVEDLPGELAIALTPEPSSLLFLGTGLLALAFLAFRKMKSPSRFFFHR